MPRRPRPSHRASPRNPRIVSQQQTATSHNKPQKKTRKGAPFNAINQEHQDSFEESREEVTPEGDEENLQSDGEDADAPRVSQWVDEDELEGLREELSEDEEPEAGPSQLKRLESNLSNLPLGALKKAQFALNHAKDATESTADEDEDSNSLASGSEDTVPLVEPSKRQQDVEWNTKPRKDITKRSNKHAPTEVTSKMPVTRFRQVVAVKKIEPRDPRFLSVAGEFKADKFQQNYNFLAEVHSNELNTLRDSLKRARKMLNNAPRHLRDGYEGEVQRLQLALKRAESAVNKDHMDKIQREALQKVSKNEKEKRKQGKGSWFLKKSDKRELITRARYDALAAEGGKRAVKKVIDKKQKKISQKEKRSRPFPKGDPADKESRKRSAGGEHDARKRRRVG